MNVFRVQSKENTSNFHFGFFITHALWKSVIKNDFISTEHENINTQPLQISFGFVL